MSNYDQKPTPKPKPKPTPKPTPKSKSTKSGKVTKTSSTAKAGPTKSCKAIYALAKKGTQTKAALGKREGYVGSMANIVKRGSKSSLGCNIKISALDYPDAGQMPSGALYYGFQKPLVCDNVVFGYRPQRAAGTSQSDYEIEHVLEWQIVTKFFEWVRDEKHPGKVFDSPDPAASGKVDFCDYFKATWAADPKAAAGPKFKIGTSPARNAMDHLKYAYPGKKNHENELVWLEDTINAPAKQHVSFPSTSAPFSCKF